jgi:hypothetical protein
METQRELLIRYSIWYKDYSVNHQEWNVTNFVDEFLKWDNSKFTQEFINVVHKINDDYEGKVVFCGSFGLVLNGLLDREVHDIDVLTFENHYLTNNNKNDRELGGSGKFMVGGKEVLRFKRNVNGYDIDVLYKDDELKYSEQNFYNKIIKVEQPMQAVIAKKQYLESNANHVNKEKHLHDLEIIRNKMGL